MINKIGNITIGIIMFIGCTYGINYVTHGFLMDFVSNPSMEIPAHVTSRNTLIFITIFTVFGVSGLFQSIKSILK